MKLIQLQILVELEKYGSFLKTAEKMYTSQPSISVLVKELEQELGHQILERSNRGVTFTPFGNLVLEQARTVVQAANQIQNLAYQQEQTVYGSMTIAGLPHLCNMLLLDIQLQLERAYPEFHLNLENAPAAISEILESVARGRLAMGLVQFCDLDEVQLQKSLQQKKLEFVPLFQNDILFVCGENHPFVQRKEVQLEELFQYPYLSATLEINRYIDRLFRQHGHQPEVIIITDFVRMRKYAAKSTAISSMPALAIQHGNQNYRDKLIPIPVSGLKLATPVGLVRKKTPYSEPEAMLIRALKERCRALRNILSPIE